MALRLAHLRALICALALVALSGAARADFYVAPTAQGRGTGASAADSAGYLDLKFWSDTVQPTLTASAQTVWFTDGLYAGGMLKLTALGHPVHALTLRAVHADRVTLSAAAPDPEVLWLFGCQNVAIDGIRFTGTTTQGALNLSYYPTVVKSGSRQITIRHCRFEAFTNLAYGAVLLGANHNVTVDTCVFDHVTGPKPKQVHAIYAGNVSEGVRIVHCAFTDIGGEYVRFRNDTDYGLVDDCTFHSTSAEWNSPFITLPLFNSVGPYAQEYFGTHYVFSNNVFRYDAPVASPRADAYCFAHYIYDSGYNVRPGEGLDYQLDDHAAALLATGTPAQQEQLLSSHMGLTNTRLAIVNPEYHGAVLRVAYRGYGASAKGHSDPIDIGDWPASAGTLAPLPLLRNGQFEFPGNRLRCWYNFSGLPPVSHPGLGGSRQAIRLAHESATDFGQWLEPANPHVVTIHCLFAVGRSAGSGVKFQVQIYHNEITNSYLAFAVNDAGQCGYLDGTTFVAVPELGTIAFSHDADGDGLYTGANDALHWYQLRITVDYSTATPSFALARGEENIAGDYSHEKSGLHGWVNDAPPSGSKAGLLNFANTGADAIVDECW